MYYEHGSFRPIDPNTKIWRFIDFTKFCATLNKSSLYFVRPEYFSDPWEGYFPKRHYEQSTYEGLPSNISAQLAASAKTAGSLMRKTTAVNCWHINEYESEAFWRSYSNKGIALQSTFKRLKESFNSCEEYSVYIGKIEYKDHETELADPKNMFNSVLWKRKSFEHEKELRAVIWELENSRGKGSRPFDEMRGQNIKVDLNALVENIYTTPFDEGEWFTDLVRDTTKHFGFNFSCLRSSLMNKPNFT